MWVLWVTHPGRLSEQKRMCPKFCDMDALRGKHVFRPAQGCHGTNMHFKYVDTIFIFIPGPTASNGVICIKECRHCVETFWSSPITSQSAVIVGVWRAFCNYMFSRSSLDGGNAAALHFVRLAYLFTCLAAVCSLGASCYILIHVLVRVHGCLDFRDKEQVSEFMQLRL